MTTPAMPAPKFATPRDPARPTLGTRQGLFAVDMLGQPFMPHQQLIADVAGELVQDPETGLMVPARKLVVVTMQRQAGKSHLAMAGIGERCVTVPAYRAYYTAQTGGDARDQLFKFEEENIRGHPLAHLVKLRQGQGSEALNFPNLSRLRSTPPTEEKLHGKQSDRVDIDEAWAFSLAEGRALMQALSPTKLTRPAAQTFVWSAGGTANSTWLAELVARGREGDPAIAYFEWAIPDDADPEDLDTILAHHPAAGRTITRASLAAMRADFEGDPAGWARAAGNRWTEAIGGAISADTWQQVAYPDPIPDDAPVAYGAARSVDGSQVAIAVAANLDGRTVVELLEVLPTAYLAADHVTGWATDGPVGVSKEGPSATLHDQLTRKLSKRRLFGMAASENAAACSTILDGLAARRILFRPHPDLDAAVRVAGLRGLGDGGRVWARVKAGPAIVPLEAATAAVHALEHRPTPVGRPRLVTAS
jgi:hypothetical protein